MLDLSELMMTQYDEFVGLLQSWAAFDLWKAKFCHLEAIVEHERLVKSVATVCAKKNSIANTLNIPIENTLEAKSSVADVRLESSVPYAMRATYFLSTVPNHRPMSQSFVQYARHCPRNTGHVRLVGLRLGLFC